MNMIIILFAIQFVTIIRGAPPAGGLTDLTQLIPATAKPSPPPAWPMFPSFGSIPTLAPIPTLAQLPTLAPMPTFAPLPTLAPMPTFAPLPTMPQIPTAAPLPTMAPFFPYPFPAFQLPPIFPPRSCFGTNDHRNGLCRSMAECNATGGYPDGTCALNLGVCCLSVTKCGQVSDNNNTYFTNSLFPNPSSSDSGSLCVGTITKMANVQQMQIEIIEMDLAPPNPETGICDVDALILEGVNTNFRSPKICGHISNTNIYVPVDTVELSRFYVKIITSGASHKYKFLVKIVQLEAGNPSLAPSGCLQYMTGTQGVLNSFNYNSESGSGNGNVNGLSYAVAFRQQAGYCSVRFTTVYFNMGSVVVRTKRAADDITVTIPKGEYEKLLNESSGFKNAVNKKTTSAPTELPTAVLAETTTEAVVEPEELTTVAVTVEVENVTVVKTPDSGSIKIQIRPLPVPHCDDMDSIVFPPTATGANVFCGEDLKVGKTVQVSSSALIVYVTNRGSRAGRGFSLRYEYMIC